MTFPVDRLGHPIYAYIPVDDKKRPLVQWKEYQSRLPTLEEKEQWISRFNGRIAGWAMPCGQVSGKIALDFDGETGLETLRQLGLRMNVKTAGNGAHVWLEAPDYPVRTGVVDSRWPGMELKGDGGYVIVMGHNIKSSHVGSPTVIGDYSLLDDTPTTEADLDRDLASFVFQPKETSEDYAVARVLAEALEMANAGRNNAGFWLSCQLRDLGQTKDESWALLEEVFYPQTPKGEHPYSKKELKDSLNSAFSKEAKTKDTAATTTLALINGTDAELWHTPEIEPFITVEGDSFPVGSVRTREFVNALYFDQFKKPLNKTALEEVIDTLKWTANRVGAEYNLNLRVAYKDNEIYLDSDKPKEVKFLRSKSMGVLPSPKQGKRLDTLRAYLNIHDEDWVLVQGLLLSHFMPDGPYPIGVFIGPQDSAKSTNQSLLLQVSDPRVSIEIGKNRLPRNDNDLVVLAKQNRVLSFDNISSIPDWLSDAFCTLSTGGNIGRRKLYTDDEIINYGQKKPILMNGIGDIVTKPDLLDRSIVFECPPLIEHKSEREILTRFSEDLPYILGAVVDMAKRAIKNVDSVAVDSSVRMADALRWCTAAGIEGFEEAYISNRNRGATIAIDNSAVGRFVKEMADKHRNESSNPAVVERLRISPELAYGKWVGTMRNLYEQGEIVATGAYDWPKKFENFVNQLHRVEPMLNRIGITIKKHHTEFLDILFIGYENGNGTK